MTSGDSSIQNQQSTKFLKVQLHSLSHLSFTTALWDREVSNIVIIPFFLNEETEPWII